MTLRLDTMEIINDDVTSPKYGYYPDKRPLNVLLENGIILLDKPSGPTSHEIVAWTKRILGITKAGHSGTLDPGYYWSSACRTRRCNQSTFHSIVRTKRILCNCENSQRNER